MNTTRNADPLQALGLGEAETAVYTTVLRLHRATLDEIAQAVEEPVDRVAALLSTLIRLGAVDETSGEYLARHPAAPVGRMVAERLALLALQSRQIDEMLAAVGDLAHHYDSGRDYRTGELRVRSVTGADDLYEAVILLAGRAARKDLVAALPDRRTAADFCDKHADMWIRAIKEGNLTSRLIVPVSALGAPAFREAAGLLNRAGTEVRSLDQVPSWFFALGDDAAGLPVQWGASPPEHAYNCSLVQSPVIVAALRALFTELWGRAVPVTRPGGAIQVLRLAAQGLSDETIARHLGLSVRTVRARFAEAIAELGANSRFQAGVEASRRAWL
ncbi:LuxR family transcriptional regulator [Microtetraspora sp. NBRC 16547]|uniref:helix-turn-helix transcriptional regulator n=1 Tax=Microtetraspora sp. NBRC 16547 TaxID=3030993 RepID=UPI0024A32F46|nr:LuxR family transcriptional regulator [Microtetraspora sp. NBRC 16547]GLW96262.1 LuxR family transcriptional regulator [Microtetraspora sp. NBRC 16547]